MLRVNLDENWCPVQAAKDNTIENKSIIPLTQETIDLFSDVRNRIMAAVDAQPANVSLEQAMAQIAKFKLSTN
jgi:hypothetical protein